MTPGRKKWGLAATGGVVLLAGIVGVATFGVPGGQPAAPPGFAVGPCPVIECASSQLNRCLVKLPTETNAPGSAPGAPWFKP